MADLSGKSDAELVSLFGQGDRTGAEGLVERYKKPLYNFILRILGDAHRAEDVFQDVFMAVFRSLNTYQKNRSFRSWIFGIAVNRCRNEAREKGPQAALSGDEAAAGPDPGEEASKRELVEILKHGVAELSQDHREVFILRMYHGMTYGEIGEILKISDGTAKSRMHYAVVNLRRSLKKGNGE